MVLFHYVIEVFAMTQVVRGKTPSAFSASTAGGKAASLLTLYQFSQGNPNVLFPAPVRDLLLQLAVTDIYKARWTVDIHREWIDNLLEKEPHRDRAKLERNTRPYGQ
jgi:hypothetical protein